MDSYSVGFNVVSASIWSDSFDFFLESMLMVCKVPKDLLFSYKV